MDAPPSREAEGSGVVTRVPGVTLLITLCFCSSKTSLAGLSDARCCTQGRGGRGWAALVRVWGLRDTGRERMAKAFVSKQGFVPVEPARGLA